MKLARRILGCLWLTHFLLPQSVQAQVQDGPEIVMGIDDFCPYTCLESDRQGYLVEVVRVILSKKGMKLRTLPASWMRLQKLASEGKVDLLGPLTLSYLDRTKLPSTRLMGGTYEGGFVTRADSRWQFDSQLSLEEIRSAGVKDYSYPPAVLEAFKNAETSGKHFSISGADANRRLIMMLHKKRVDAIPMLIDILWYHVSLLGLNKSSFRVTGSFDLPAKLSEYRVGVTVKQRGLQDALIHLLDSGFAAMRDDGSLQKIKNNYGIGS